MSILASVKSLCDQQKLLQREVGRAQSTAAQSQLKKTLMRTEAALGNKSFFEAKKD